MSYYRFPLPSLLHTTRQSSAPMVNRRAQLDRAFDGFFNAPAAVTSVAVDAREDATGFTLEMDIPGVAPESVDVVAEDGQLVVRSKRAAREVAEGETVLFAERTKGEFERRFRLSKVADLSQISASYALGVLTVRIAKVAPAQPKRVPVTVA
jgi:HSP20 family protein